jgi:hypothetical protein
MKDSNNRAYTCKSAGIGELRAILASADQSEFLQILQRTVDQIRQDQQPHFSNVQIGGEIYNVVFRANAGKLGLLAAPLPRNLAIAYYQINGIAFDLNVLVAIAEGAGGQRGDAVRNDWRRCLAYHEDILKRGQDTRNLIGDVINKLEGVSD